MEDIEMVRLQQREFDLWLFLEDNQPKCGGWHSELRQLSRLIQNYEESKARLLQTIESAQAGSTQVTVEELQAAQAGLPSITERDYARRAELENAIARFKAKQEEHKEVRRLLDERRPRVKDALRRYAAHVMRALPSHLRSIEDLKLLIVWEDDCTIFRYGGRNAPEGPGHGTIVIQNGEIVSSTRPTHI